MRLSIILDKIKQKQNENLPGFAAQAKMSPPFRPKFTHSDIKTMQAKESAVLILLYEKEQCTHIAFTQRHEYKGAHSGQISFPGGKKDETDLNYAATAMRETLEEIGVVIKKENIVKELTWLYVPPSNFIIYPFVAFTTKTPVFIKQDSEVKEILEFSIADLLNKESQKSYLYTNEKLNVSFESPSYQINNKIIWGATAMILSEFLNLIES